MAEKGAESVAINEITEAADVGFGSFYNHFDSKNAIYAAVLQWVLDEFGEWLDRLRAGRADPAEVVSVCVRHTVMRAQREPVWGRFLSREGNSPDALKRGLAQRLRIDVRKGVATGRFATSDVFMAFVAVSGVVVAAVNVVSRGVNIGLSTKHWPERTAAIALQSLGLGPEEAARISRRPLPADSAVTTVRGRSSDSPRNATSRRRYSRENER